jgi:sulfur carrier protein ThiS
MLILTTTAVAAGYLGGFDRLVGIIGEEQAEKLSPVEGNTIIADLLTEEGIRIEVVAVGIDSHIVDFYFTLEDMVSNRLYGDIWVHATVFPVADDIPWSGHEMFPEVIDRSDDGIITLRGREVFSKPITEQELRFNLYHIAYNVKQGEQEIDINLATLESHTPAAWIWDTPVLPPNMHNIEMNVDGIADSWYTGISGVGIIDGMLHIQQWLDSSLWNPPDGVTFRLINPDGEPVMFYMAPQWLAHVPVFTVDTYGNITNEPGESSIIYHEYIYEVNMEQLSEYRIVAEYIKGTHINLSWWSAVFEIPALSEG